MKELIPFIVALIVVINPIGMLPVFYGMTDHMTTPQRRRTARFACITIASVLLVSLFGGLAVLNFFGIDIDSFRVGGGIYLLLFGLKMLRVDSSAPRPPGEEGAGTLAGTRESDSVAIVPLGIPILAGPATISTAVLASQQAHRMEDKAWLVGGVLIASLIVWLILRIAGFLQDRIHPFVLSSISRIMGLLLVALAVKFITDGLKVLLPGLLGGS